MIKTAIEITKDKGDIDGYEPGYCVSKTDSADFSFFYPAKLKPIEGHYLIVRYSRRGGGPCGWDPTEKFVGIAHTKKGLSKKILKCALDYAKILGAKQNLPVVDRTGRSREGKLVQLASNISTRRLFNR